MKPQTYSYERDLVSDFLDLLKGADEPWGLGGFIVEFEYSAGRTDVVAMDADGAVFAFEAKLTSWRNALAQAYRNRCFAHRSFVVLPSKTAYHALRYAPEFRRRGVGLCLVSNGSLVELLSCEHLEPSLAWLSQRALGAMKSGVEGETHWEILTS